MVSRSYTFISVVAIVLDVHKILCVCYATGNGEYSSTYSAVHKRAVEICRFQQYVASNEDVLSSIGSTHLAKWNQMQTFTHQT